MEKGKGMTRREFLKRNALLAAALFFAGGLLKPAAGLLRKGGTRRPNVSDREARYYRTLAG